MDLVTRGEVDAAPVAITSEGLFVVLHPNSTVEAVICSTMNPDLLRLKEDPGENEGDENEGDEYEGDGNEIDENEGDENEGDENEGDGNERDEYDGDEIEGEENEGDEKEGDIFESALFQEMYIDYIVREYFSSFKLEVLQNETGIRFDESEEICYENGASPAMLLTEEINLKVMLLLEKHIT